MWSKLIGSFRERTETSVQIIAKEYYDLNNCNYHNWQHILDCYDYLEKNQVTYDEDLDYAVLHHDIVYDDKPEKEQRSADLMLELYPGRSSAAEIIMATADHSILKRDLFAVHMIKADLHQLCDPAQVVTNYVKLMDESKALYNVNDLDFATANIKFLRGMRETVFENSAIDNDVKFWNGVLAGIDLTIHISNGLISSLTKI